MNRRNWIKGVLGVGAASSVMAMTISPAATAPEMDIFERIKDMSVLEQARILKAALRLNPELRHTLGFRKWAVAYGNELFKIPPHLLR